MRALLLGCVLALASAGAALAEDGLRGRLQLTSLTGLSVATTTFGVQKAKVTIAPLGLEARRGAVSVRVSAPLIKVKGAGRFTGPNGEPLMARGGRVQGYGDLSIAARFHRPKLIGGLDIAVTGAVKAPTAPAAFGLGTGKADFRMGLDITTPSLGDVTPFARLGYRAFGDPVGQDLRNGPMLTLGANIAMADYILTLAHDYARAPLAAASDLHEVYLGVSLPLGANASVTAYGLAGLSDSAPDYSYGLMFTAPLR